MPAEASSAIVKTTVLPSRGYLYGDKLPGGEVQMSPMKTKDEKLMAGNVPDREALIDTLLSRCLITDTVPYDEFLLGDKYYMLMFLRAISYGTDYNFPLVCSRCKQQFNHVVSLPDGFSIRVLTEDDEEVFYENLSISGKRVGLRRLRVKDEKELSKEAKRRGLKTQDMKEGDPVYEIRLARAIVSIDGGEVNLLDAVRFVEDLYGQDSLDIRNSIDGHDCGPDVLLNLTCPGCGALVEDMLPFSVSFFRPKRSQLPT